MLYKLKRRLYFVVASYFTFWAKIVLHRWKPRIIVVTGSSGKTTTLHLIEAQLGDAATYSHHANSAFGISFQLLGLEPNVASPALWLWYALRAPFGIFRSLPKPKLYVVEADCDRPHEGQFSARFLRPEVTIWVSALRTHSMNFDRLVNSGQFNSHVAAIAYEFGYFPEMTSGLVITTDEPPELVEQLQRVPKDTKVIQVSNKAVMQYEVKDQTTNFHIAGQSLQLKGLHTKELGTSLQMVTRLMQYLEKPLDPSYKAFQLPPGRNTVFKGKKDTMLVDSTYNTGLGATAAVLRPFQEYKAKHKWLVLGDILEQGSLEQEEHEGLATLINKTAVDQVVLLGPRTKQYTLPLVKLPQTKVHSFESPKEVLDYLNEHLEGGEVILFKGGRFLEGVIEQLLVDSSQADQLVRRGATWQKRRQQWGLPR